MATVAIVDDDPAVPFLEGTGASGEQGVTGERIDDLNLEMKIEVMKSIEEETDGRGAPRAPSFCQPEETTTRPVKPAKVRGNDNVAAAAAAAAASGDYDVDVESVAIEQQRRSNRRTKETLAVWQNGSDVSGRDRHGGVQVERETDGTGSKEPRATRKRKSSDRSLVPESRLQAGSSASDNVIDLRSDEDGNSGLEGPVVQPRKKANTSKSDPPEPPEHERSMETSPVSIEGHAEAKAESKTRSRNARKTADTSSAQNAEADTSARRPISRRNANASSNEVGIDASASNEVGIDASASDGQKLEPATPTEVVSEELPPTPYVYEEDPNEYYVEEEAHIYHDPPFPTDHSCGVLPKDLRPIPPPPPVPTLPNTRFCRWSFDEDSRVLLAEFCRSSSDEPFLMDPVDSKFLFEMFERDDITVISRGLLNLSRMDATLWNLDHITQVIGREFFHKIRRFDRIVDEEGFEKYIEMDKLYSMRFEDYGRYYAQRLAYVEAKRTNDASPEELTFAFVDHLDKEHTINVETSALYMIDVDIKRSMPWLFTNFMESFEMPAVLPGGSHCMMNSITPNARPFMGPNLYITPPASFTHFHQDGHGTVDSGHLCISGYNEVVILRRLTERHKKHALWILTGNRNDESKPNPPVFDGLYSEPHGDGLGEKPGWPTNEKIQECKRMGYFPSVCILKPGDLIHINKGRLHAFRKMSTSILREEDCHAQQRQSLIAHDKIERGQMCISVAWDWMYRGVTGPGINREMLTILEAAILNRKNGVTSLAVPELSLLQMAKTVPTKTPNPRQSFLNHLPRETAKKQCLYDASKVEICIGILPGLSYVVDEHVGSLAAAAEAATSAATERKEFAPGKTTNYARGKRLSLANVTDSQENPMTCPLDPYGDSDFACKLCRKELSNVYYHCDGCEKLLSKDFNICKECHAEHKYMQNVPMHPSNPKKHATLNHTGSMTQNRMSKCPCKTGPRCNFCGFCLGCSCRCHTFFTVHTRFYKEQDERGLLEKVKEMAGTSTLEIGNPWVCGESQSNGAAKQASEIVLQPLKHEHCKDVDRMTQLAQNRLRLARECRDAPEFWKKSLH